MKRSRPVFVLPISLVLLCSLSGSAVAQEPEHAPGGSTEAEEIVTAYREAFVAQDMEAAGALLADDIVYTWDFTRLAPFGNFDTVGSLRGIDAMESYLSTWPELAPSIELEAMLSSGHMVSTAEITELRFELWDEPGVRQLRTHEVYTVGNGKIERWEVTATESIASELAE